MFPIAVREEDEDNSDEENEDSDATSDIIRRVLVMQQVQNYAVVAATLGIYQAAVATLRGATQEPYDPYEAESSEDENECNSTSERAEEERLLSTTPNPASKATSGTRPGPQQPRIPILDSSKVKKIMDWRAHVASQLASQSRGVQVELTANKRRGGYLERVDFLQRVQDRRQDVLEDPRPNKRRKK